MSARLSFAFMVDSVPFTKAVRDGETSLGGSESACLGLARALAARGHDVHLFTTQLADDAMGADAAGVIWHPLDSFAPMNQFIEWDVCVALRSWMFFAPAKIQARLRLLWNQDLLVPGGMVHGVMSVAWAFDKLVYVSDYHRAQWEDLEPAIAGLGYVSRNGFDTEHVPAQAVRDPNRIIHVSRPERGLKPLLAFWPALRKQQPAATLHLCRYSSMYDQGPGSWSDTCAAFDRQVEKVNAEVGGITYLGELNKPALYKAIAESAVMWYPGVSTFAETSCIAAIESQACGTPFVGSLKGGLVETARPSYNAGLLIPGVAEADDVYGDASIAAVLGLLKGCQTNSFQYRQLQRAGRKHVESYAYVTIAAEWEAQIVSWFAERYESNKLGVLRQLLHEDDHTAARIVADDIVDAAQELRNVACRAGETRGHVVNLIGHTDPNKPESGLCDVSFHCGTCEAFRALQFCDYVIAGKDQTSEQYGNAAIADPLMEAESSDRFKAVIPQFERCTAVLDVACGNGSFAIALALANPTVHVYGLDYAESNIERAKDGAERAGVADRCIFERATVYDFDRQAMHDDWQRFSTGAHNCRWPVVFDGLFVGEFVEHVGACTLLVDSLEAVLKPGATVVYTCPSGACAELVPRWMPLRRGHVHRFHHDDLKAVWGPKQDFGADYLASGITERGNPLGNWLIHYTVAPNRPAGERQLLSRIQRTRPMPKLSVGIIAKDAETDLARCLESVWRVADEIVVGDTGSRDKTKAIAAEYGAKVIDVTPIDQQPEGFAGARNAVLEHCTGDWFLWIDADEQLIDGFWLRRYMESAVFNGYVLQQTHLYLDGPPTHDIPIRLFRTGRGVRFFGCIHEQPQEGEANKDITPSLEPFDVKIAHTGYLTERIRADKRVSRNLPLLLKDQQVFPDRVLGQVLCIREAVVHSDEMVNDAGGMTARAQRGYAFAVQKFVEHFDDPTHKFHQLARPWYEAALQHLGIGYEFELGMAGKKGPMGNAHAKPMRVWVRNGDELARLIAWRSAELTKGMVGPTFKTDPFVLPSTVEDVEGVAV